MKNVFREYTIRQRWGWVAVGMGGTAIWVYTVGSAPLLQMHIPWAWLWPLGAIHVSVIGYALLWMKYKMLH